ncbi:3-keto-5-aminohexanoate cleavage protein [Streptomyces sp. NRRL S-87]|uniref:3-keto-5-aminohexanoate cleavage protein n=1 Tax=Streptomyces sp. NRRL S-87 TaxID=1463920 RepID=UPI00068F3E1C|nr:3-keto-5-aminohexanoate cleavage protein [Streptomyces sp. NRRL S-87]
MIQAALNGARSAADGTAVPLSPAGLAASAAAAAAAGAHEVQVRPKTPCGRDSLSPRVLGPLLAELRSGTSLPVGVDAYTGGDRVAEWTVLPERAAVDWALPDAEELARLLLGRGVAVEAVVRSGTGAAARFLGSPLRGRVLRIVAEVAEPDPARAPGAARDLLAALGSRGGRPVLVHGSGRAAWPVLRTAARLGLDVRTGLADTLELPSGARAASNAELVAAAVTVVHAERPAPGR